MKSFGEKFWTTSHLQNTLLRFHCNNLLTYPINPRVFLFYFQHTVRRSSGCRKEEPPTKCKKCEQADSEPSVQEKRVLLPRFSLAKRSCGGFPRNVHTNLSLRTLGDAMAGPAPGLSVASSACNTPFKMPLCQTFLSLRSDGFTFQ